MRVLNKIECILALMILLLMKHAIAFAIERTTNKSVICIKNYQQRYSFVCYPRMLRKVTTSDTGYETL